MNRRTLPIVLMLVAAAITSVLTYINEYSIINKLMALSITLLVFYFLGVIIRNILDYFDAQNEAARREAEEKKAQEEREALEALEAERGVEEKEAD